MKLLLTIFFAFGVISASVSAFPNWAFLELGNYFLLALLALFIAYSIQNNTDVEKSIIITFCIAVALYLVAFLASLFAGLTSGLLDYHYLLSGFINRRFLNQFQSISFPILLMAPIFLNSGKRAYLALSALAAFWFMLMLVSDGRGVIIASLIGLLLSCVLIPFFRMKWLLHSAFVISLGILIFLGFEYLLSFNEVVNGNVLRGSSGGRITIWLQIIETIKENPILGIGPMHYAILPTPFTIAHPHNITLQLMAEYGIPAALALVTFISISFIFWVKQQQATSTQNQSVVPIALTASFITAVIHGHLSGVFVMPLSQLSFMVICGWMIGISRTTDPKSVKVFPFKIRIMLILISILFLSAMLTGSYSHLKSLALGEDLQAANPNTEYPAANASRYWSGTYR